MSNTNCRVCGRELTDAESVKRGIGPDCWRMVEKGVLDNEDSDDTQYVPPLANGDIPLKMVTTAARREVFVVGIGKRYIVRHSPTGLRWGYGGSGPSDLALNVLMHVTGDYAFADKHYQAFKAMFITRVHPDGGILNRGHIDSWVAKARELDAEEAAKQAQDAPELPTPYSEALAAAMGLTDEDLRKLVAALGSSVRPEPKPVIEEDPFYLPDAD